MGLHRLKLWLEGLIASHLHPADHRGGPKLKTAPDADAAGAGGSFDHSLWDGMLRRHVRQGKIDGIQLSVVDYVAVAADPALDQYRAALAAADVPSLSPNERLALYINAYNCLCIGLLTTAYTETGALPSSITALSTSHRKVWDAPAGVVGGEQFTLGQIEHSVLRGKWAEPRIHAAIVCASVSCPDLRAEAYVGSRLNVQLDEQCGLWLANTAKGAAAGAESNVVLSRIFLWFKADFATEAKSVRAWVARHLPQRHAAGEALVKRGATIDYFEYNWAINAVPPN
jgi:hypothetical protein